MFVCGWSILSHLGNFRRGSAVWILGGVVGLLVTVAYNVWSIL